MQEVKSQKRPLLPRCKDQNGARDDQGDGYHQFPPENCPTLPEAVKIFETGPLPFALVTLILNLGATTEASKLSRI